MNKEWISIKDKQPEYNQRVLFCQESTNVVIYKYVNDSEFGILWEPDDNEGGHGYYIQEEDYWMELPKGL